MNNVEDVYPLSPLQEGMLFHTLEAPGSGVYIEQVDMELAGPLDPMALRDAWRRAVDRHPALRTAFFWEGLERPVQVVRRQVPLDWQEEDWRGSAVEEQRQRIDRHLHEDRCRGFDLTQAPLLRLSLFRTGEESWRLVWSFHHILLDGWSLALLLAEVLQLAHAFFRGEDPDLPRPLPFRTYIDWLERQDLTAPESYWRRTLAGFQGPTTLPLGRAHPVLSGGGGYREEQVHVPLASSETLRAMARRHRLTLNTLLQGAWALLLGRLSGSEDVVFGTVVSGRPTELAGSEAMIGLFINTLPARVRVAPERPLAAWLKALQAEQVEARQYEHSPLAEVRRWAGAAPGTPLFESLAVFENYEVGEVSGPPEGRIELREARFCEHTHYPLVLESGPSRALYLRIGYACDRFERTAILRLLGCLRTFLETFPATPERPLSELPLLTPAERHQVLSEWNQTARDYPGEQPVHKIFAAQAERAPDAPAVFDGATVLSYRELDRRAARLASRLRVLGAGPGVAVGVFLERSAELVVTLLAVLESGGICLPLDPEYPAERLAWMLEDSGAALVVTEPRLAARLPAGAGRLVLKEIEALAIRGEDEEEPCPEVDPADLAYLIYTSGSTGQPKGIGMPHRAIVRLVCNTDYIEIDPSDRVAQVSNSSFDAAIFEIWGALLQGAAVVVLARETVLSPWGLENEVRAARVTVLFLTTALLNQVTCQVPPVRCLLFGGEAADPHRVREVLESGRTKHLLHVYGPTESTTFATCHRVEAVRPGAATVPIGRPIANTRIYLLDRWMGLTPIGGEGELCIGGDGLARGYWRRPDLTAEKFVPDPFGPEPGGRLYHTGDLARSLEDGAIEFLVRLDHQVKVRGFRIEPGEIEATLGEHPDVWQAVVLPREDAPEEKRLVAYVVLQPGRSEALCELRSFLQGKLPGYMVPAAFVELPALPLTKNGKLDRRALPAPEEVRPEIQQGFLAPRTALEEALAQIWRQVLRVERVGVRDGFFELGGDSLLAVRLMAQIRKRFGRELPLSALFSGQTIEKLAGLLRQDSAPPTRSPLVAMQPHGRRTPLFCIHPGSGNLLCYFDLVHHLGGGRPVYGLQDPALYGEWSYRVSLGARAERYVAEIQRVWPHGPYLLCGWSFGGHVAFEMAQQLHRSRHEVALLAILDTDAPADLRECSATADDAYYLSVIAGEWNARVCESELRRWPAEEQRDSVVRAIRETGADFPGLDREWVTAKLEIFKSRVVTLSDYKPCPYPGRITLFLASDDHPQELQGRADPSLGWRALAEGGVEVHFVPGSHATLAAGEHGEVLARRLAACLEEVESALGDCHAVAPGGH
jgi:surfactin family lipopeptide synthetase C